MPRKNQEKQQAKATNPTINPNQSVAVVEMDAIQHRLAEMMNTDDLSKRIEQLFAPKEGIAQEAIEEANAILSRMPAQEKALLERVANLSVDQVDHGKVMGAKKVIESLLDQKQQISPQVKKALVGVYELIGSGFTDEIADTLARELVGNKKYQEIQTGIKQVIKKSFLEVVSRTLPFLTGTEIPEVIVNSIDPRTNESGMNAVLVLLVLAMVSTVAVITNAMLGLGNVIVRGFQQNWKRIGWLIFVIVMYLGLLVYQTVFIYNRAFVAGGEASIKNLEEEGHLNENFNWTELEYGFSTKEPRESVNFISVIFYWISCLMAFFSFWVREVPERVRKYRDAKSRKEKLLQAAILVLNGVEKGLTAGLSSYHFAEGIKEGGKLSRLFSQSVKASVIAATVTSFTASVVEATDVVSDKVKERSQKIENIFTEYLNENNLSADTHKVAQTQDLSRELLGTIRQMKENSSRRNASEKSLIDMMERILVKMDQVITQSVERTRL
jgi:hypothetical protein